MISFLLCLAILVGGYFVYGKIVDNTFGPDDRETPAVRINDGVDYVVIGTAAVKAPGFLHDVCSEYGGSVIVSLDAKDGMVMTDGWTKNTGHSATDLAKKFEGYGVDAILYTDISRDGMLTGCNVEATAELASQLSIPVIASGGIRDLDDIRKLLAVEDDGVTMAILGRSLYEGTLDFTQALDLVEATEAAKDNQANNEG